MQTITLKDGRCLSYSEYGDRRGRPVFFFHGLPGSCLFRPPDDVTEAAGVRLICSDRPGYGGSTFQPGRRILDWPGDVARLADHLGIGRFALMGHSGGAPYVLACACAFPDRVTAAVSLAGAGPIDAPGAVEGMLPLNRFGFTFARYVPWPVWRVLIGALYRRRRDDPEGAYEADTSSRCAADEAVCAQPAVRQMCVESDREALRPGLTGMAWDARLLMTPWGVALGGIRVPVQIWHGTTDNQTSVGMARHMAAVVPGARLELCEGEGHMLLIPHWAEILAGLPAASE